MTFTCEEPDFGFKPHPRCSICQHPRRVAVEMALARGSGRRSVGQQFDCSADAVWRHWQRHCPPALREARAARSVQATTSLRRLVSEEGGSALEHLAAVRQPLFAAFDVAVLAGDTGAMARLASRLHTNIELVSRLTGDLGKHIRPNEIVITSSPSYLKLRHKIVEALRGHPEAARSVTAALAELEDEARRAIAAEGANEPPTALVGPAIDHLTEASA